MIINITLQHCQKVDDNFLKRFELELNTKVNQSFPSSVVNVQKGASASIYINGFPSDSDRERLEVIFGDIWRDEAWN